MLVWLARQPGLKHQFPYHCVIESDYSLICLKFSIWIGCIRLFDQFVLSMESIPKSNEITLSWKFEHWEKPCLIREYVCVCVVDTHNARYLLVYNDDGKHNYDMVKLINLSHNINLINRIEHQLENFAVIAVVVIEFSFNRVIFYCHIAIKLIQTQVKAHIHTCFSVSW